jgi:hypothetical protein
MVRFNLICHGLMWFVEEGDKIRILIPEIPPHSYLHGPIKLGLPHLIALNPGEDFTLDGIPDRNVPLRDLVNAGSMLVLDKSQFDVLSDRRRNSYVIPKPDLIRLFRAAEVLPTIFGKTPTSTALAVPVLSHDVVCFSYLQTSGPVSIKKGTSTVATFSGTEPVSWNLYAQPTKPESEPHDITPMNEMLWLRATGNHPDYRLSIPFACDEAHGVAPKKGMDRTHLRNLAELHNSTEAPETDRVGCHGGFIVE